MKTIAILYGGKSSEHEVSLVSATSVVRNIDTSKYRVVLIGINKKGVWYLQDDSELTRVINDSNAVLEVNEKENIFITPGLQNQSFKTQNKVLDIDVVFPVVHGSNCEDGILQGVLDTAGIAYVGCGCLASSVTMDKEFTKLIWSKKNLPVVPYVLITKSDINDSARYDAKFTEIINTLGFPLFVKPCNAGSSVGANKASNEKELSMALMEAFFWDNKVLVEKAINAREVECSVTGLSNLQSSENPCSIITAYTPGEILPTHEFYSYEAKYTDPDGAKLAIPANLTSDKIDLIKKMAVDAYKAVDASGLSRVDFFIDKDTDEIYLNEINTLPGFTSISMFPKMCQASGLEYKELIELLIDEAILKHKSQNELRTSI